MILSFSFLSFLELDSLNHHSLLFGKEQLEHIVEFLLVQQKTKKSLEHESKKITEFLLLGELFL